MAGGKFSIIIATHNDGEFLGICIDSVLNQTYMNFELIIVNDGSTDETEEVCKSYQKRDSRVQVINQECRGAVWARQRGIQEATGDYIYIIDGDDWIDERTLEIAEDYLNRELVDAVFFNIKTFGMCTEQIFTLPALPGQIMQTEELIDIVLSNTNHSLCNKIFRRNAVPVEKKFFDEVDHVRVGLDKIQLFSILPNVKNAIYIDRTFYYYRIREQSVSHKKRPAAAYEIGLVSGYVYRTLKEKGLLTEDRKKNCCINYLKGFCPRLIILLRADISQSEYSEMRDKIRTSTMFRDAYGYANKRNLTLYYVIYVKLFRHTMTEVLLRFYCRIRKE